MIKILQIPFSNKCNRSNQSDILRWRVTEQRETQKNFKLADPETVKEKERQV